MKATILRASMVTALALLASGCSGKDGETPGDGGGDTGTTDGGTDSGGTDSGGTDGGTDGGTGGASLSVDYEASCGDPGARDSQGPYQEALTGGDWANQNHAADFLVSIYHAHGAAVEDLNGDGLLDVYLPQEGDDQLFLMRETGELEDVSASALPGGAGIGVGATAADVDGDGDLDLYVATVGGADHLLINDGAGVFSDATAGSGLEGYEAESIGSAWADFDGDGDLDPFVVQYGGWDYDWIVDDTDFQSRIDDSGYRGLFTNEGGGVFTPRAGWLPVDILRRAFTFAAGWFDMDGDGLPELYLADDYRPEFGATDNLVYDITADGVVTDISSATKAGIRINSMGLSRGDVNGDALPDLLISGIGEVELLTSVGDGTWVQSAISRGLTVGAMETSWGTALADLDNDGDQDALVGFGFVLPDIAEYLEGIEGELGSDATRQPDRLWLQGDDGQFTEVAADWGLADTGMTRTVIAADFNRDGWLDVLRRYMDKPATIHLARCGEAHWLRVRLRDAGGNPFGVGARIEATAGGEVMTRWIDAGSTGIASGAPLAAHFGLGDAGQVDELSVYWPDGEVSVFSDVAGDRAVVIERE